MVNYFQFTSTIESINKSGVFIIKICFIRWSSQTQIELVQIHSPVSNKHFQGFVFLVVVLFVFINLFPCHRPVTRRRNDPRRKLKSDVSTFFFCIELMLMLFKKSSAQNFKLKSMKIGRLQLSFPLWKNVQSANEKKNWWLFDKSFFVMNMKIVSFVNEFIIDLFNRSIDIDVVQWTCFIVHYRLILISFC